MKRCVNFEVETLPGVHLAQRIIPVASSGSYVPGGRYPMLASAHMTVITPKVAGVEGVVGCSPPVKGMGLWPATLYSMAAAGADEIYCLGGVHALSALAFGIEGLERVDMLVGAGFLAEAKRQIFGTVGIDLLAGPTEILIIADETADPLYSGRRFARTGRTRSQRETSTGKPLPYFGRGDHERGRKAVIGPAHP